jgi:hypothetical protein
MRLIVIGLMLLFLGGCGKTVREASARRGCADVKPAQAVDM